MRVLFTLFALSSSLTFHSLHIGDELYTGDELCKKSNPLEEHKCIRLEETADKRCVLYYNSEIIVVRPFTWKCVLRYTLRYAMTRLELDDRNIFYDTLLWSTSDANLILDKIK